jgi:hypothetical protein
MDSFTEVSDTKIQEIERKSRMELLFRHARLRKLSDNEGKWNRASERDIAILFLQVISYSPEISLQILSEMTDRKYRLRSDLRLNHEKDDDQPSLMDMCRAFLEYRKTMEGQSTYPDKYSLQHLQYLMQITGAPGSKHYELVLENHPNLQFARILKEIYGMTNYEVAALNGGNAIFDKEEILRHIESRVPVTVELGNEDGNVEIEFYMTRDGDYLNIDTYSDDDREFYPEGDNFRFRNIGATLKIENGQVEQAGHLNMGFLLFGYEVRYRITDLDKEKPTVTILEVKRDYHYTNKYMIPPMSNEEADAWHKHSIESGFEA